MRAIIRRCLRSSLGASSRSVWAWQPQMEQVLRRVLQLSAKCSSLISRSSAALVIAILSLYTGRRRMNRTRTGILWARRAKHIRAASSEIPLIS